MTFFKKIAPHKWELLFLITICAIGIAFRAYNHDKWLHFEVDQTWDYHIVSNAVTGGISNLPLLGPTAGGGRALRLGPAFYYMEYVSALLFGNTPAGHSMTVLIFSILTLPLFYVFIRRYFSVLISSGLLSVFAVSLYLILYARFSWSPNVLPFLILLTFYALLRCVSKNEKHPRIWFLIMVLMASISTQIHFNAFFTIPAIVISFLFIKRPRFNFKTWGLAIAIVILLYSPMIANEIKTSGENSKFFVEKIGKGESHRKNFAEKAFLITQYHTYEYFLILSGNDQINGVSTPDGYTLGMTCKTTCFSRLPVRITALLYFLVGVFLLIRKTKKEPAGQRKDFLILSSLWLVFSFLYFYAIFSSNILFPRFFLVVSPLAFILLGLILENIKPEKNKQRLSFFIIIIASFSVSNIIKDFNYLNGLRNATTTESSAKMKDVFPTNSRVTLQQEQLVTNYIASKYIDNTYPVYLACDHEYEPSFWYFLNQKGIKYYTPFLIPVEKNSVYEQANYFSIYRTNQINKNQLKKISDDFLIVEKKELGSLTVFYLNPRRERITATRQAEDTKQITIQKEQISQLMTWDKLSKPFSPQSTPDETIKSSVSEEELP